MKRCKCYRIVKGEGKIEGQEHWHIQWHFGEDWYAPSGCCHWSKKEAEEAARNILADNGSPLIPARFQPDLQG